MPEVTLPLTNEQATEQAPEEKSSQPSPSFFRKWGSLVILSLALAIIVIDTTLLNVSLSKLIIDLHTNLQNLQWVITAYALALAALTITGGRLGDLYGRKKMFILGAGLFAVGSFIASISTSMPELLIGESLIEGIGAALMLPATSSLLVANYKGKDRAIAFGVWGGVAGASSAIGPLLGGYLTTHFSWRWGFRINIVIAAIAIVGALLVIADSRDDKHKPTLDIFGVILSALGLTSILFGVIESASYGWWKAKHAFELGSYMINFGGISIVPIAIAFGVIMLVSFVFWELNTEKKGNTPLVSMKLFENAQFTSGMLTTSILSLGMTGLFFSLPIFLQSVKNLDAFHTGLALLSLSIALLIAAPLSGFLSKKIAAKYLIQIGLVITFVAMFVLRAAIKVDMPLSHLIPGLFLYGFGMGLVLAPASNLTLSAVSVQEAGEASGVNNTMRQVGSSLGAAIVGAALLTALAGNLTSGISQSTKIPEQAKQSIINAVNNPKTNIEFGFDTSAFGKVSPEITNEIESIAKSATTEATRNSLIYAAMFVFLGIAASLFLPAKKIGEDASAHEEPVANSEPQTKKLIAAAIMVVAGLGSGIWFLHTHSKFTLPTSQASQTDSSLTDIRSLFQPPAQVASQNSSNTNTSTSTGELTNPLNNQTTNAVNAEPRGPLGNTSAQQNASSTIPVAPSLYTNNDLGVQFEIMPEWSANTYTGNTVAFTSKTGRQFSIQSFPGENETLNDVQAQLNGSPSVSKISSTQINGREALAFRTTDNREGYAFLVNGNVYYLIGNVTESNILSSLKFVG